jgi:putative transposase
VIYECKYHICWLPKYRYPILTDKVALRVRELIRQIAVASEVEIISGAVSSDHIHIYVSILPSLSVSKLVQFLNGSTPRRLKLEFEDLRKKYWGQHI